MSTSTPSNPYLSVEDIALNLHISTDSVTRLFCNRPGVLDLGSAETRSKRRYRVLRIPVESFEKFKIERQVNR